MTTHKPKIASTLTLCGLVASVEKMAEFNESPSCASCLQLWGSPGTFTAPPTQPRATSHEVLTATPPSQLPAAIDPAVDPPSPPVAHPARTGQLRALQEAVSLLLRRALADHESGDRLGADRDGNPTAWIEDAAALLELQEEVRAAA